MKTRTGVLKWNVKQIAVALKILNNEVKAYFTDGRRVPFILERRLARKVLKGKLAPSESAGFDLIDCKGGKWEVRSISKRGIYFCPSYMVGYGRTFNKKGFMKKLSKIKGYIISDIASFPEIPFWIVSKKQVLFWWKSGELGRTTKISRQKALELANA